MQLARGVFLPSSRAMHADHPLGCGPPSKTFLSQSFSNGDAYFRLPTPHAWVRREADPSLLVMEMWLENHLSPILLLFWGTEARGLHASIVPPPTCVSSYLCRLLLVLPPTCAAPSTVTPTRGYQGVALPNCRHFLVRTWSKHEAGQHPTPGRLPTHLTVPLMGPTKC